MYFLISEELVDREDLGIYEKMALVVLARYANGSKSISKQELVERMGADKMEFGHEYTDIAIKKLIKYGILSITDSEEIEVLKFKEFQEEPEEEFSSAIFMRSQPDERHSQEPTFSLEEKHAKEHRLMKMIEDKALEFSEDRRFNIVDLSIKENVLELEHKRAVPIEEVKSVFSEVCSNQTAKILYNLSEKNLDWLKRAYLHVKEEKDSDALERLAEFLQKNSYESFLKKEKEREREAQIQQEAQLTREAQREREAQPAKEVQLTREAQQKREERTVDEKQTANEKQTQGAYAGERAPDLDFYNGYDLKSLFSNLEKKFDSEESSGLIADTQRAFGAYEKANEIKEEPLLTEMGRVNIRATSFKQAKNRYSAYGSARKSAETVDDNTKHENDIGTER